MIKAVVFDMFETIITQNYDGAEEYVASKMAQDVGISESIFVPSWRESECRRSIGVQSTEEVLTQILKENKCYSDVLLNCIVGKRLEAKRNCFEYLHPEIIPMFEELKKRNIKIGLISNCFSEEAIVIRESRLFSFFDVVYLSCEQGIVKPNKEIYLRCLKDLAIKPEECLYVGDGGSNELVAAESVNLKPLQAIWYINNSNKIQSNFTQVKTPLEIIKYL